MATELWPEVLQQEPEAIGSQPVSPSKLLRVEPAAMRFPVEIWLGTVGPTRVAASISVCTGCKSQSHAGQDTHSPSCAQEPCTSTYARACGQLNGQTQHVSARRRLVGVCRLVMRTFVVLVIHSSEPDGTGTFPAGHGHCTAVSGETSKTKPVVGVALALRTARSAILF